MHSCCALDTCGQEFEAKRLDARYCSPSCRAKASRLRRAGRARPQRGVAQTAPIASHPASRAAAVPEDLAPRLARLETKVARLEDSLNEPRDFNFADLGSRVSGIEDRFIDAEAAKALIEREVKRSVDSLKRRLDKFEEDPGSSPLVEELQIDLDRLEATLSELAQDRKDPRLGERVAEVERGVIELARRGNRLKSEFEEVVGVLTQAIVSLRD